MTAKVGLVAVAGAGGRGEVEALISSSSRIGSFQLGPQPTYVTPVAVVDLLTASGSVGGTAKGCPVSAVRLEAGGQIGNQGGAPVHITAKAQTPAVAGLD